MIKVYECSSVRDFTCLYTYTLFIHLAPGLFYIYDFRKQTSLCCLKITMHQETKMEPKHDVFTMSDSHTKNKHQFMD